MNEVTAIVPHVLVYSRLLPSLIAYIMRSPRARGTLFRPLSLSLSLPRLLFFLLFLFFFSCSPCYSPTVLSSKNLLLPRLLHLFPRATRTLLPLLSRAYSQSTELTTIRTLITASINFHHRPGFRGLGHRPPLDYSWLGFYRSFKFYFMTRERRRRIKERKNRPLSRAR